MRWHYREHGRGRPLVFLHGGWGYEVYPLDAAIPLLSDDHRLLIPDRSGYGLSSRGDGFAPGFHRRAALETLAFLDALNLQSVALWGHSDGAVVAGNVAIQAPGRCSALVLESIHYDRRKPGSREFFERVARAPETIGARAKELMLADHGERWREVLTQGGRAWLDILETSDDPSRDLFGGRLSELRVPTLLLHGDRDPRTEPGELEAVVQLLPHATLERIAGAGHSPHSAPDHAREASAAVARFLRGA